MNDFDKNMKAALAEDSAFDPSRAFLRNINSQEEYEAILKDLGPS